MKQAVYQARRAQLAAQLQDNSMMILCGAKEVTRNNDCHFPFRQNSDFYYLTGFNEPDAAMVLTKQNGEHRYILFNRAKNYQEELWEGLRAGQQGATAEFGADEAYPITELEIKLPTLMANKEVLYYQLGACPMLDSKVPSTMKTLQSQARKGMLAPSTLISPVELIGEMRLIKDKDEIAVMRQVAAISAEAHVAAIKQAKTAENEYQLAATLQHHAMMAGCQHMAYGSIVAGGANACILHYTDNNQPIESQDLILIDAGAELDNYAADITRTFPKSGRFSEEQRAIYQIVLDAQIAGVEMIKPGLIWTDIQQQMVRIICQGLIELGILKGELDALIDQKVYSRFYMHNSGHWLGLDVHDSGNYKVDGSWRPLQAGMVLTVEPGIYIADHHQDVDSRWNNIGVRIEDDILVTERGYENLTAGVPKTIDDIEALMQ